MSEQEVVAQETPVTEMYSFNFTRAEVELIIAGLAELPAKHSMYFIQGIQNRCAEIDKVKDIPSVG